MRKLYLAFIIFSLIGDVNAQEKPATIKVYPKEIFDVLNNPGIGFTTFQRFNGDELNPGSGWTEGEPIKYQEFDTTLINKDHPQTTIAYFRIYWSYLEPKPGKYNWALIDKALRTAAERGQTLMFRVAPYGEEDKDVPAWYRDMVGKEETNTEKRWRVDPENPKYLQYFGGLIKALGKRYDGHPDLESVDISIVGFWGEGAGSHLLTDKTRIALINCYLDNFKKTNLHLQPLNGDADDPGALVKGTNIAASWPNGYNNGTGPQMRYIGYRLDCLGDVTTEIWKKEGWSHMRDLYPRDIVRSGMGDAWKKAPVTMEICWTFLQWLEKFQFDEETVSYIFSEALKWHISSFNAKSSPVPQIWSPLVDKWLNKMGYRFVLRKFEYPSYVYRQGQLSFSSLWENIGVAPIYKDYLFAVRIRNERKTQILPTTANIREWLPGDIVHDENLYIPFDLELGKYQLEIAIVSPVSYESRVKLAIEDITDDGWYPIGEIEVREPDLQ
ncbi:DUF4832 domain-containing protein [Parabacteroides sp.]